MQQDAILKLTQGFSYKHLTEKDSVLFLESLKKNFSSKKVVILGAGITGRFYEMLFTKLNLKIAYFTDRNADRISIINATPVFPLNHLLAETDNTIAIIAGNPSIVASISSDIQKMNMPEHIVVVDGSNLISVAKCALCYCRESIDLSECSICYNKESFCTAFLKQIGKNTIPKSLGKADSPLIGYILGQVCTLKCKHCCESVPYIKSPIMVDTKQVIADIKKIAAAAGFIARVEFIGGEPFLHKGLSAILKAVLDIDTIGYVVVFTNATVIPKDDLLETLKNPRIVVNFSGYKNTIPDSLKKQVEETRKKLHDAGIKFAFYNPDARSWLDINCYNQRDVPESTLETYYMNCFMASCHRIFNGVFYGCPHQYSGMQLGKIKKEENECIEIHNYSDKELADWFMSLKQLKYFEACKYCNLPYNAESVEPAIQL